MDQGQKQRAKWYDIYNRYRPNTAIWIGRLVPLIACVCLVLLVIMRASDLAIDWDKDVLDLRGTEVLLFISALLIYVLAFVGTFKSGELKGGMFALGAGYKFDEFEQALTEKSRLYAFRALAIILIIPAVTIIINLPYGAPFSEPLQSIMAVTVLASVMIVFTMPAAVYHWSLKLVPEAENIRPGMGRQAEVTVLEKGS